MSSLDQSFITARVERQSLTDYTRQIWKQYLVQNDPFSWQILEKNPEEIAGFDWYFSAVHFDVSLYEAADKLMS